MTSTAINIQTYIIEASNVPSTTRLYRCYKKKLRRLSNHSNEKQIFFILLCAIYVYHRTYENRSRRVRKRLRPLSLHGGLKSFLNKS